MCHPALDAGSRSWLNQKKELDPRLRGETIMDGWES